MRSRQLEAESAPSFRLAVQQSQCPEPLRGAAQRRQGAVIGHGVLGQAPWGRPTRLENLFPGHGWSWMVYPRKTDRQEPKSPTKPIQPSIERCQKKSWDDPNG